MFSFVQNACLSYAWVFLLGRRFYGRFHVLPDFDEGKRSCRRKLERHNNRRRRKPADSKEVIEKESQGDAPSEDISGDGEVGKGIVFICAPPV